MSNDELVTLLGNIDPRSPFLMCCEHAGNAIPGHIPVDAGDRRWLQTHWGYDIGALALAAELAASMRTAVVCAHFSRLLCDPNRPWGTPECILPAVEGHPLRFNAGLDEAARAWRKRELHDRYHELLGQTLARRRAQGTPFWLLAVHTLTPVLGKQVREHEVSLLFDRHAELAALLRERLERDGFSVALNEPYSGLHESFIHSVSRHGRACAVPYIQLEVRQDLVSAPADVAAVAARVQRVLADVPAPS